MRKLELQRRALGLSQRSLGRKCSPAVSATYICNAERHGFIYPAHLERIADAIGWRGDPSELMEEVEL